MQVGGKCVEKMLGAWRTFPGNTNKEMRGRQRKGEGELLPHCYWLWLLPIAISYLYCLLPIAYCY